MRRLILTILLALLLSGVALGQTTELDQNTDNSIDADFLLTGSPADNTLVRYDETGADDRLQGCSATCNDSGGLNVPSGQTFDINGSPHTHDLSTLTDSELTALGGLTSAANALPYFTGSGTADVTTLSAFARSYLDDADEATFKATVNLEPGTDVQTQDAELQALAGLTSAANALPYFTGSETAALTTLSAYMRGLLDDADEATLHASLNLEIGTDVQDYDGDLDDLADGSLTGTKVGFSDANGDWTASNVDGALVEMVESIGGGYPNQATSKVHWSQLTGVPAGFADNTDDGAGASIEDDAYGSGWDGDTTNAPSQNAVHDYLVQVDQDYNAAVENVEVSGSESVVADGYWQALGTIKDVNAGMTISKWRPVLLASDGKWDTADSDAGCPSSCVGPAWGVATAAGSDNNELIVMVKGTYHNASFSWATPGSTLYLSDDPGTCNATTCDGLTITKPSTTGDIVQPMGRVITDDLVYIDVNPNDFYFVL